jgi:hypothetical protein
MSIHDGPLSKLAPKYFGPYQAIERLGAVTYQLQLPPKMQIHNVFHVTFFKKFEGTTPTIIPPLPQIVRGRTIPQLVKWASSAPAEATWE